MTYAEMTAIRAHMIDAAYPAAKTDEAMALVSKQSDYRDADDFLALAVGSILNELGDRLGVEPGTVAALVNQDNAERDVVVSRAWAMTDAAETELHWGNERFARA